jgi:hypothetical protein
LKIEEAKTDEEISSVSFKEIDLVENVFAAAENLLKCHRNRQRNHLELSDSNNSVTVAMLITMAMSE